MCVCVYVHKHIHTHAHFNSLYLVPLEHLLPDKSVGSAHTHEAVTGPGRASVTCLNVRCTHRSWAPGFHRRRPFEEPEQQSRLPAGKSSRWPLRWPWGSTGGWFCERLGGKGCVWPEGPAAGELGGSQALVPTVQAAVRCGAVQCRRGASVRFFHVCDFGKDSRQYDEPLSTDCSMAELIY